MGKETKRGIDTQQSIFVQPSKGAKFWHIVSEMNLEDIIPNEISQTGKDQYGVIPLTRGS